MLSLGIVYMREQKSVLEAVPVDICSPLASILLFAVPSLDFLWCTTQAQKDIRINKVISEPVGGASCNGGKSIQIISVSNLSL